MAGFIYIMSNPSFGDGRIKIGKSDRDPEEYRKYELDTTGVPEPFVVEYYAFVDNHHDVQRLIHQEFSHARPNPQREYFKVSVPEVIHRIRSKVIVKFEAVNYKSPQEIEAAMKHLEAEEVERERKMRLVRLKERDPPSLQWRKKCSLLADKIAREEKSYNRNNIEFLLLFKSEGLYYSSVLKKTYCVVELWDQLD